MKRNAVTASGCRCIVPDGNRCAEQLTFCTSEQTRASQLSWCATKRHPPREESVIGVVVGLNQISRAPHLALSNIMRCHGMQEIEMNTQIIRITEPMCGEGPIWREVLTSTVEQNAKPCADRH